MIHLLKTDPEVFHRIATKEKTFELRKDDRHFQVDDHLILLETVHTGKEMKEGKPLIYTGAALPFHVPYILRGPAYGLEDGWVILSIKPIE